MAIQQVLEGVGAFVRTHVTTYGTKNRDTGPIGGLARRELDEEIGRLAAALDRRLDRDASFSRTVLLRCDGKDVCVTAAKLGMCTVVTGRNFLAADLVLSENVLVDLNAMESGSIEVSADMIAFDLVDGRRIEIVTIESAPTIQ